MAAGVRTGMTDQASSNRDMESEPTGFSPPNAAIEDRPLAVVTGASSGIGLELARQFVDHHFDLIVAAEDDEIAVAAAVLRAESSGQVDHVQVDLRDEQGVADLYARIRADGRPLAGTRLVREHAGVEHAVTVLADGFEWEGRPYSSLSAVARHITGMR